MACGCAQWPHQKDKPPWGDTTGLTLNQKVLEFARAKIDQQVGTGECWDLAEDAVTQAGDGRLIILEQHVRPAGATEVSKKVQEREIFVKNGAIYKKDGAKITVTTKGTIKAYRPKASK